MHSISSTHSNPIESGGSDGEQEKNNMDIAKKKIK